MLRFTRCTGFGIFAVVSASWKVGGEATVPPRVGIPALIADVSKCTWLSKTGSCPVEINTGASRCGPGRDTDMGSF